MIEDFSGKTAIVTGASRGLGAAIARTLSKRGAKLFLLARDEQKLNELSASLPHESWPIVADFCDPNAWSSAADKILDRSEAIDVLVNNAGVAYQQELDEIHPAQFDETLNVNVRNLILFTHAMTPAIKSVRGNIVSISSICARSGWVGQIAYSTSKGAINAFTKNASLDLGRFGVRVNAVAPGVIDDGIWKTVFESGADEREIKLQLGQRVPLEGRWGRAADVANAVAWLASEQASYVTGHVLNVDGGMVA